jgi:hypothetical protein
VPSAIVNQQSSILPRLSERSGDPAIGALLCPVKFTIVRSEVYLVASENGTGADFTGVGPRGNTGTRPADGTGRYALCALLYAELSALEPRTKNEEPAPRAELWLPRCALFNFYPVKPCTFFCFTGTR